MSNTRTIDRSLSLMLGVIILLRSAAAGKLEIRRMYSHVEALLGHNTTIPCHFSGYNASDFHLSIVSVRWTQRTLENPEQRVYLFDGGKHTADRPGSHIPDSKLLGGDASLHIPNIQFMDEGEYTCNVITPPDEATSKVTVQVSAVPSCTVSDSTLQMHPNTERSVTCHVNGFHPETVKIQWVKNSKASSKTSQLDDQTFTRIPVQNQDGTYNVTSVLYVKPVSTDEDGDIYSCVIHHRPPTGSLTCDFTLSVTAYILTEEKKPMRVWTVSFTVVVLVGLVAVFCIYLLYYKNEPPKISDIKKTQLIDKKNTSLVCLITGFRPRNISISLYLKKGGTEKSLVGSWQSPGKGMEDTPLITNHNNDLTLNCFLSSTHRGLFSCICAISITPNLNEHNGARLILEVEHEALTDPIFEELLLEVTGN
ncbi:natural cytotoxicity triggering receptor 3 ligand 1-like isoform X2 [Rhinoderma darwinii]|uniref:natural cytotoxicity triggering receptor 3 ligand 1-like isoform X2 n=1 Tax=Rhinoderma darwinii TaxID=43563 RepID=UPI003F66DD98